MRAWSWLLGGAGLTREHDRSLSDRPAAVVLTRHHQPSRDGGEHPRTQSRLAGHRLEGGLAAFTGRERCCRVPSSPQRLGQLELQPRAVQSC